jgi:adenylate cyclase
MSCELDGEDGLGAEEIREACTRVVASPAFRASPQLSAFLRFVVEATLSGQSERIKGYTIAVEALGRDADFDPQTDPIVRVEAGRLRRALERYYGETGVDDPVAIELPRGSYVPVFNRRNVAVARTTAIERLSRAFAKLREQGRRHAAAIGFVALGAVLYHAADMAFDWDVPLTRMRDKLTDALSRFDEINVVSDYAPSAVAPTAGFSLASASADRGDYRPPAEGAPPGTHIDYRLAASAESPSDGIVTLMFRLIDTDDSTIVWSRTFDRLAVGADPRDPENNLVRELATLLGQPFGIIHTHERVKAASSYMDEDPRYLCLLKTYEYWRDYDRSRHAGVQACLQRAIEEDPTFALGYAALARLYFREYQFGAETGKAAAPLLDRALHAAREAIRLKPTSVRAHRILADIYLAQGNVPAALAAGDKALSLNPYDLGAVVYYGTQLAALGEIDKAKLMLRKATFFGMVRPVVIDFGLFLIAYLSDDIDDARLYARELPADRFSLGLLARALLCQKSGDRECARQAVRRLVALQPAWQINPRGELAKFFPGPPVVDKLAKDLTEAGLTVTN